jgi:hypothetical protein
MDEYNSRDGVTSYAVSDSYIETAPINCAAVSSVVVKFKQYFRLCCENYNLEMMVTKAVSGGCEGVLRVPVATLHYAAAGH